MFEVNKQRYKGTYPNFTCSTCVYRRIKQKQNKYKRIVTEVCGENMSCFYLLQYWEWPLGQTDSEAEWRRSFQLCIHVSLLFYALVMSDWCHLQLTLVLLLASSSLLFCVFRFDTIVVVSALIATIINSAMKSCECCLKWWHFGSSLALKQKPENVVLKQLEQFW